MDRRNRSFRKEFSMSRIFIIWLFFSALFFGLILVIRLLIQGKIDRKNFSWILYGLGAGILALVLAALIYHFEMGPLF